MYAVGTSTNPLQLLQIMTSCEQSLHERWQYLRTIPHHQDKFRCVVLIVNQYTKIKICIYNIIIVFLCLVWFRNLIFRIHRPLCQVSWQIFKKLLYWDVMYSRRALKRGLKSDVHFILQLKVVNFWDMSELGVIFIVRLSEMFQYLVPIVLFWKFKFYPDSLWFFLLHTGCDSKGNEWVENVWL